MQARQKISQHLIYDHNSASASFSRLLDVLFAGCLKFFGTVASYYLLSVNSYALRQHFHKSYILYILFGSAGHFRENPQPSFLLVTLHFLNPLLHYDGE